MRPISPGKADERGDFCPACTKCIDLCVDVHVEERPVASVEVLVCFKLPSYGANFWYMFFVLRLKNV